MSPPAPSRSPDLDVETEVFADHVILRPPNRLKERATRIAGVVAAREPDPVLRAQNALDLLSNEFDDWMAKEVDSLEAARLVAIGAADVAEFTPLYRAAHDIRGQAATLGFPLAGELAEGLCDMIERAADAAPSQQLIDVHVDAIRAIVREGVRDRENPIGAALVESLARMRASAIES